MGKRGTTSKAAEVRCVQSIAMWTRDRNGNLREPEEWPLPEGWTLFEYVKGEEA